MIAYGIYYHLRNDATKHYDALIDARDIKSAKRKIARKHKKKDGTPYKDGRVVVLERVDIVGYY